MSLINPVKTTSPSGFFSVIDKTFGEHRSTINGYVAHYIDDAHSLGFYQAKSNMQIYINSVSVQSCGGTWVNSSVSGTCYYIFSKNKTSLWACISGDSSGTTHTVALTATKASTGKWNVFLKSAKTGNTNEDNPTKLYYSTPSTSYITHEPALRTSAANNPYIISP